MLMNFLCASGGWGSKILQTLVGFILSVPLFATGPINRMATKPCKKAFMSEFSNRFFHMRNFQKFHRIAESQNG